MVSDGRFDGSLFSRGVRSFTHLAERTKNIYPKCFPFHVQTILQVAEILVKFHCWSLYRNDRFPSWQVTHLNE